jgi:hypothetical protein
MIDVLLVFKISNMKYKHMQERLSRRQSWWEAKDERFKAAHKKPGSVKGR